MSKELNQEQVQFHYESYADGDADGAIECRQMDLVYVFYKLLKRLQWVSQWERSQHTPKVSGH